MMAANLKESLHTLADQLPDNATWEIVYQLSRERIEILHIYHGKRNWQADSDT